MCTFFQVFHVPRTISYCKRGKVNQKAMQAKCTRIKAFHNKPYLSEGDKKKKKTFKMQYLISIGTEQIVLLSWSASLTVIIINMCA